MEERLPASASTEESESEDVKDQKQQVEENKHARRTSKEKDLQNALEDMKDYAATRKFEEGVYKRFGRYYSESDSDYETSTPETIVEEKETWQNFREKDGNGVDLFDFDAEGEIAGEEREGEISDELDVGEIVYEYDGPGFEDHHDGIDHEPVREYRGPGFEADQRQTSCFSWLKNYFRCLTCRKILMFGILLVVICAAVVVTYFVTNRNADKKLHKDHDGLSENTNSAGTTIIKDSDIQKFQDSNTEKNSDDQKQASESLKNVTSNQTNSEMSSPQDLKYQDDNQKSAEIPMNNSCQGEDSEHTKKSMDSSTILNDQKHDTKSSGNYANSKVPAKKQNTSAAKIRAGVTAAAAVVAGGIYKVIDNIRSNKKKIKMKNIVDGINKQDKDAENLLVAEALKEARKREYQNYSIPRVERLIKITKRMYSDKADIITKALEPQYQDLNMNKVERLLKITNRMYSDKTKAAEEALDPKYKNYDMNKVEQMLKITSEMSSNESDNIKRALREEYQRYSMETVEEMIQTTPNRSYSKEFIINGALESKYQNFQVNKRKQQSMKQKLFDAVKHRDFTDVVKSFAEQKIDLDQTEEHSGRTFLHFAAQYGKFEIVQFLAKQKVDLDQTDKNRQTPVSLAVEYSHLDIVRFLVNQKVNLDRPDKNGRTVIHHAAMFDYPEILKLLAEHKVNLIQIDKYGYTPLHYAAQNNCLENVKFLASKGADLNQIAGEDENTPLHLAAIAGSLKTVKFLAEQEGVDLEKENSIGYTPWISAVFGPKSRGVHEIMKEQMKNRKSRKVRSKFNPIGVSKSPEKTNIMKALRAEDK